MKIFFVWVLSMLLVGQVSAQYEDVKKILQEGTVLHDAGKYNEAIAKYDEALAIDPRNMDVQYEKSYTLYVAKRYDESKKLCEKMIDDFKGIDGMENVYTNLGSLYDDIGEPKKAIKIYNKGIGYFPDFYLLYFNRGITELKLKENEDALISLKKSASLRNSHLSTNYWIGNMVVNDNKYAGLLAFLTYLAFDRSSARALDIWQMVNKILEAGVKRTGPNSTTITISADMLGKNKRKEDDFSSLELMIPLMTANRSDSVMQTITKDSAGALDFQMQMIFGFLKNDDHKKGFFWTHYAPMFAEMKDQNLVGVYAHLLRADLDKDSSAQTWLNEHTTEVAAYNKWIDGYK